MHHAIFCTRRHDTVPTPCAHHSALFCRQPYYWQFHNTPGVCRRNHDKIRHMLLLMVHCIVLQVREGSGVHSMTREQQNEELRYILDKLPHQRTGDELGFIKVCGGSCMTEGSSCVYRDRLAILAPLIGDLLSKAASSPLRAWPPTTALEHPLSMAPHCCAPLSMAPAPECAGAATHPEAPGHLGPHLAGDTAHHEHRQRRP